MCVIRSSPKRLMCEPGHYHMKNIHVPSSNREYKSVDSQITKAGRAEKLFHPGHSVPVITPSQSREHLLCSRSSEHQFGVPMYLALRTQRLSNKVPQVALSSEHSKVSCCPCVLGESSGGRPHHSPSVCALPAGWASMHRLNPMTVSN